MNAEKIETIISENGYPDFKWISGEEVEVRQWPRFKCMFGCPTYGKSGACPPSVPSVQECQEFFKEYRRIAIIHIAKKVARPDDRKKWGRETNLDLLKLEKAVFLSGHRKAFLLFMDECGICEDCPGQRDECLKPRLARPCPEGLGVDVFATVRKIGFPIEVLTDYEQEMNRYAFLMVE
ncbi:Metal-binding protein [Candidatus Desulfarcum epimagneticum]|uniref:Metal-binding protein n=1 Tax=uncultured Desulfobacteraceae bacterium TaxID=218296 RepID=A0A484HHL2_9BACT|nr:Metal-binding protein [uncultured Desulfobacteraceae bacterium]